MKYAVVTFGCRVNQADSLTIEDALRARGATAGSADDANVVIVNTCSVTASADQAARQTIRRVARVNPSAKVVVTGCYATRRPDEAAALPNVLRVVSNSEKDVLGVALGDEFGATTAARDGEGPCGTTLTPGVAGRTALTLRVQTGCDEACSYCIIPSTRGTGRSTPLPAVLEQVHRAIASGYKEIALTGVHLGSYGRDLSAPVSLIDSTVGACRHRCRGGVSNQLARTDGLQRRDCGSRSLVTAVRAAFSSAAAAWRGFDAARDATPVHRCVHRRLVERIACRVPHAAIGSDIIAGFPGETNADVAEMQDMLRTLPLTYLHVFPYSDRPGTAASARQPKVDGRDVRARAAAIREIAEEMSRRFRLTQIGRSHRALTVDDGQSVVTGNYLKLRLDAPRARNEWITVRVTGERDAVMLGDAA